MRARTAGWMVVAAAAAALCLSAAPPLLARGGHPRASAIVHLALSPVCHQEADRSVHLAGRPMAVCARCAGIQAGFLLGSIALALSAQARRRRLPHPPHPAALALAACPMAAQWLMARLPGLPALVDGHGPRALSGAVFGAVLSAYVLPAVVEMAEEIKNARRRPRHEESIDVATA